MYSMSSLVSYESFVDECVAILVQRFSEIADSGSRTNVGHWLQCFAFDVIGKITVSILFPLHISEKGKLISTSFRIGSASWTQGWT